MNRGSLPAHLPRIEVVVDIDDKACPCCRGGLHRIGEDVSERLDILPARFRVLVTRRPKYACRSCEEVVVQAPPPARLIAGGIPTEATVGHVLVSKYADHLPLYRQAQIFARQGINLDRSTLADWVGRAAWHLPPLHERLLAHIRASTKIFADETTAPVRRRFYELAVAGPAPIASEALQRIAALYEIEKDIRGREANERRAVRQEKARPLIEALEPWLREKLSLISQKTKLAEAIRYALSRWDGLTRFIEDSRIEIDSNVVERAVRPIALNRKNALFAGSDGGGEHWAIVASLIETCKLNGADPQAYIADVLTKIVNMHPSSQIDDLMPWAYAPQKQALKDVA